MKLHFIQHVPFEGLGYIAEWAQMQGISCTGTKQYNGDPLPLLDAFDILVVMGGPMGVNDTDTFIWLNDEKQFIAKAIEEGKYVVGICLGAQLIADVLGSDVSPNKHKEIGWFPVELVGRSNSFPFFFDKEIIVFHWHGDMFQIPEGATHLMLSDACPNQAFLFDKKVLGLQCHFELQKEGIEGLLENCADELTVGEFVQSADDIRSNCQNLEEMNKLLGRALTLFVGKEV